MDSYVCACLQLQVLSSTFDFWIWLYCLALHSLKSASCAGRSGGSIDRFWPNIARKTQAVVDAVMQVIWPSLWIDEFSMRFIFLTFCERLFNPILPCHAFISPFKLMANPWTSFKFYEQHCEVCSNKNHCTADSICIRIRFMDQIALDPEFFHHVRDVDTPN